MAGGLQLFTESGDRVVEELIVADGYFSRLRGLAFRKSLEPGKALLLVPSGSVHTHWMRFAIDIVMLDKQGVVLEVKRNVGPWKFIVAPKQTHAVLECVANTAGVKNGDRVRVQAVDTNAAVPAKSLSFLCSS